FAFRAKPVRKKRKIDGFAGAVDAAFANGSELVLVDRFGIVEQSANQSGLAVVHTAGRRKAKKLLVEVTIEKCREVLLAVELVRRNHLEIALTFFQFHRTFLIMIDSAVFTLGTAE